MRNKMNITAKDRFSSSWNFLGWDIYVDGTFKDFIPYNVSFYNGSSANITITQEQDAKDFVELCIEHPSINRTPKQQMPINK